MVGGVKGGVDQGWWQAGSSRQVQEERLELAAGQRGLWVIARGQGCSSSVPVCASQHVVEGAVVVEARALGLGQRALETVRADAGGEVEQGAGHRGDGDAVVAGGVLGIEGP